MNQYESKCTSVVDLSTKPRSQASERPWQCTDNSTKTTTPPGRASGRRQADLYWHLGTFVIPHPRHVRNTSVPPSKTSLIGNCTPQPPARPPGEKVIKGDHSSETKINPSTRGFRGGRWRGGRVLSVVRALQRKMVIIHVLSSCRLVSRGPNQRP